MAGRLPTYSSWLDQVEGRFVVITDTAVCRGSFTSVKHLVQNVDHFVMAYGTNCQPFKWTANVDSILEKLDRLSSCINGTGN